MPKKYDAAEALKQARERADDIWKRLQSARARLEETKIFAKGDWTDIVCAVVDLERELDAQIDLVAKLQSETEGADAGDGTGARGV